MSRRRGGERSTPLDQEFASRGLMRTTEAARYLGVDREVVHRLMKGTALSTESFDHKGQEWFGIPIAAVEAVKQKMGA